MNRKLPDDLGSLLAACPLGVLTLERAAAHGFDQREIARWVDRRALVRMSRGAFAGADAWGRASAAQQHLLRAVGMALALYGAVALSHVSAALWHDIPLVHPVGSRVHLVRTTPGQGRSHRGHLIHRTLGAGSVVAASVTAGGALGGPAVTIPVLAAFGVAQLHGFVAGVVALDAVLHRGLTTTAEVEHWLQLLAGRPGTRLLTRVAAAADQRSESPLETQVRLLLVSLGYRVELQRRIISADGEFVARVDLYLPDLGVVVEVDGTVKYVASDGSGSVQAVMSEKRREKALVDLGFGVVRVEHHDLEYPGRLVARITAAAVRVRRDGAVGSGEGGASAAAIAR